MKRTLFITTAGILLLLVFTLWVYLLFFGAPKQVSDVFTNFGLGQATERPDIPFDVESSTQLNLNSGSLAQLTSRPVAGFDFVTDTNKIIYAEKGTGHVYEIDTSTGIETRISAKTSLAVIDAVFAPNGQRVVLISETEDGTTATLETFGNGTSAYQIPPQAENIRFVNNDELRYTIREPGGLTGYVYDFSELERQTVFTTPLQEVRVLWGAEATWLYSKPAANLAGTLYHLNNSGLSSLGRSGYSFSTLVSNDFPDTYITTAFDPEENALRSRHWLDDAGQGIRLPLTVIPDKCSFDKTSPLIVWCGAPLEDLDRDAQTQWYKGSISFTDMLWRVDLGSASAQVIEDLLATTQRNIDVIDLKGDATGSYLLFKNKTDDTLWLKRLGSGN